LLVTYWMIRMPVVLTVKRIKAKNARIC